MKTGIAYLRVQHLPAAAWEGIELKCVTCAGRAVVASIKCWFLRSAVKTDPSFVLFKRHPIPQRRMSSGPGGRRPPGKKETSSRPRNWVTAAGRWGAKHAKCNGGSPGQIGMGSPGRCSFLPGALSPPPYRTSHTLNGTNGLKRL